MSYTCLSFVFLSLCQNFHLFVFLCSPSSLSFSLLSSLILSYSPAVIRCFLPLSPSIFLFFFVLSFCIPFFCLLLLQYVTLHLSSSFYNLYPSLCLSSLISVFFPFSSSTYIVLSFSFLHLPPLLSPSPCLSLLLSPSVTVFLLISSLSLPALSYLPIYLGLLHCLSFVSAYSAQRTPPHCKI